MTLRKVVSIGLLLVAVLPNLSMRWTDAYKILNEGDIALEKEQTHPELSSVIGEVPHWESFDRWKCFYSDEVEYMCADVCWRSDSCVLGGWEKQPFIFVLHKGHLYEFEDENHYDHPPCETILNDWRSIMERQSAVCIYGAYLQEQEVYPEEGVKRHTSWVLSRLKTYSREWKVGDSKSTEDIEETSADKNPDDTESP